MASVTTSARSPGASDLAGQPRARPADAALHLVDVQQRAGAVAGGPGRLQEALRRQHDAGLAEHRLEHDRRGPVGDRGVERGGVAVRDEGDRAGQRAERRALGRLPGDGERAEGAAVEGAVAGDPAAARAQPPGDLEPGLVGLRAGVGEQHALVAGELLQPLGEQHDRLADGEVADVAERAELAVDGLADGRVGVAEHVDGDAGVQVDVRPAVDVLDDRALAADQRDDRRAVVAHQGGVPAGLPLLRAGHAGTTIVPIPVVGEQLEQQAVRHPAVEHVGARHAAADRPQAGLHLRDHAAGQAGQQRLEGVGADRADDLGPLWSASGGTLARPVGVQALDVGEDHQLLRADRDGERGGGRVGVDVVELAVGARRDRGDDRHLALVEQRLHDLRPHLDDLADLPEVDLLAVDDHPAPLGGEQPGVLAGQADGERAVGVDQPDDLRADLADEDHADDLHRLGGRHPEPAAELAGHPQAVEVGGDLRPAAVHDHDADPGVPQEHDVLGERRLQLGAGHRVAAVLDDDGAAGEGLQPGQRLDERGGLGQRGVVAGGRRHVEYALFSWT